MARWDDEKIDLVMGRVLQAGVGLASAIMVFGAILYLVRHGGEIPQYHAFRGAAPELRSPRGVLAGIREGQARALLQLGALIMIATPVLRVAFAVYAFARERDRIYIGISLTVLAILAYGLFSQA